MWPERDHHCSDQFQIEWKIVLRKHVLLLLLPGTNSKVVLFLNFQQLYNRLLHSETRSIISEATDYSFSLKNVFFFFFFHLLVFKKRSEVSWTTKYGVPLYLNLIHWAFDPHHSPLLIRGMCHVSLKLRILNSTSTFRQLSTLFIISLCLFR